MENQPISTPLLPNKQDEYMPLTQNYIEQNSINNNKIISSNKDKTFNKLRKLQKLIKKEAALKELCK